AQSSGASAQGGSNSMQSGSSATTGGSASGSGSLSTGSTMRSGDTTSGVAAQRGAADHSNARVNAASPDGDMSSWANEYARSNQGRISRDAYLEEMGRRWDQHDQNRQGLTPDQLGQVY